MTDSSDNSSIDKRVSKDDMSKTNFLHKQEVKELKDEIFRLRNIIKNSEGKNVILHMYINVTKFELSFTAFLFYLFPELISILPFLLFSFPHYLFLFYLYIHYLSAYLIYLYYYIFLYLTFILSFRV